MEFLVAPGSGEGFGLYLYPPVTLEDWSLTVSCSG